MNSISFKNNVTDKLFVYKLYTSEDELKINAFFFSTEIITDAGTCIIHQNEACSPLIASLLLNMVTVSLSNNVPPSYESMFICLVKLC